MSNPASNIEHGRPIQSSGRNLLRALALLLVLLTSTAVSIWVAPGWPGVAGAGLAAIALAIAVTDYRTFRIPNGLNLAGFILALIHASLYMPDDPLRALVAAGLRGAVIALAFLALWVIYKWIRGREGFGLGDVKLAAVAGAWLGWVFIPVAIQFAAFAALSAYAIQHMLYRRPLSLTSRLPFGAFFAPAIWFVWVLEQLSPTI
jgi:leader peptidase (prepilin peptidase) / N-methyltransferase